MGASHSSDAKGRPTSADGSNVVKVCYYDQLGIAQDAADDELR